MEDFFLMLVKSPGYIFGPLMMLAGLVAVVMCVRATLRPERANTRRALRWSAVPPALGVVGAIYGAAVGIIGGFPANAWVAAAPYLAGTILFGVFVAIVPALWALVLLQRRPTALA
jgi:hypothetical protein